MEQINVMSKMYFLDSKYTVALSGVVKKKEGDGYNSYYGGLYIRIIENRDTKNPLFSSYLSDQAVHMLASGVMWNGRSSYVFNDTSKYIELHGGEESAIVIGEPGGPSLKIPVNSTILAGFASTMLSVMAAIDGKIASLYMRQSLKDTGDAAKR